MIENKLTPLSGTFNGLNQNPLPLEFSQSLSTTKNLAALLYKIDEVIKFTNNWYIEIIKDLENNGVLYEKLYDSFLTEINKILLYEKPLVSISSSPNDLLYYVGDTINGVMLNYTVTKKTNNIIKAEIYKNDVLVFTNNTVVDGLNSYVDTSNITTDTTYFVKIYDGKEVVTTSIIRYEFVYKIYYGKVLDGVTIDSALISTLNNVKSKDDFNILFDTLNDEKIVFVTHELLNSVYDSNNNDLIESFTKSTINIKINNVDTPYYLYVSTDSILDTDINLIIEK